MNGRGRGAERVFSGAESGDMKCKLACIKERKKKKKKKKKKSRTIESVMGNKKRSGALSSRHEGWGKDRIVIVGQGSHGQWPNDSDD